MSEQILTREFSICLSPDTETTHAIEGIRQKLPDSPYRDDPPHITLLRGITSPSDFSDEELINYVDETLSFSNRLPLSSQVKEVTNMSNQFYTASGLILLDASRELTDFRKDTANLLAQNNCTIETQELDTFTPHITIRLGVPLEGGTLSETEALFKGRVITFSQWLLFRLITDNGKRIMHEIRLR